MEEALKPEDVGTLIREKADRLARGDGDPDELIHDIMETLGRAEGVQIREKEVDQNGRISIGRPLSGTHGTALFHATPDEDDDGDDGGGA